MSVRTYRSIALSLAEKEVGTKESPPNSNDGPRVRQYQTVTGAYREPWCASFVQWCFKQAGYPQPLFSKSAYVPYIVNASRNLKWVVKSPQPGDLACYDWQGDGTADHIGFVRSKPDSRGNFTALEGNTAVGNDSNGGEVLVRDRNVNEVQAFVRVPGGKPVKKPAPKPKPKPKTPTVNVAVNGKTRLKKQRVTNPALLKRVAKWIKTAKTVAIKRNK